MILLFLLHNVSFLRYNRTNVRYWRAIMMRYLKREELQIASRFLFLSMAIIVIRKDMKSINLGVKIEEPYLNLLEKMLLQALNERKELRKDMRDKKIQVHLEKKDGMFTSYLFICQGREEIRSYFHPAIRKKVENILQELMIRALQQFPPYASANS